MNCKIIVATTITTPFFAIKQPQGLAVKTLHKKTTVSLWLLYCILQLVVVLNHNRSSSKDLDPSKSPEMPGKDR